ncbi:uncharacterized protein [Onthophagus taurus]|uniref:uncharacterized protein n=1 Tax=Onthophagus taurus TaxID=166361 RepID=UPI000C20046A|nr:uncharacterized protein LOC111422696 [Onthophagus taurus]
MGWLVVMMFTITFLHCTSISFCTPLKTFPEQIPDENSNLENTELLHQGENENLNELGKYLVYILANPWPRTGLPLLYVEDYDDNYSDYNENLPEMQEILKEINDDNREEVARPVPFKRSRYYRKYPWKRQNSRQAYEAENRYLCQPSKDDVFRLLVALHEAKQGNKGRTINFCNRKRPASAIFTNIRFLGK